jgi:phosphoribosylglycinamide formyltransferase-1
VSRRRTAVLISGRGTNMAALIAATRQPSFPAEIVLVVSNRPEASGLAFAKAHGIATAVVDHKIYAGRDGFEGSLQAMLASHRIEFLCLAGFMRLLTASFVGAWHNRIINIHPALLPAYRGLHTHARALQDGVKIHGCTVHFVVAALDAGPIIAQAAVPVLDSDTTETLAARVLRQEHILYPLALELVTSGSVEICDNRVRIRAPLREPDPLMVPAR